MRSLLLSLWVLVHASSCLCPPRRSLCFPSPVGSPMIKLLGLQGQIPQGLQSLCRILELWFLTWGSEPSVPQGRTLVLFSSLWSPTRHMGFDFIVDCALSHCLLPTRWGFFFCLRHKSPWWVPVFSAVAAEQLLWFWCSYRKKWAHPFYSATLNQKQQIYSLILL